MQPGDVSTANKGDEFEFADSHNLVFDGLAKAAMIVAVVEIVLAVASAVPGVMALIVLNTPIVLKAFIQVLVFGVMGLWTLGASKHVKLIVSTEGNDVDHLMTAMSSLRKLFLMQSVVFLVMLVTVALETLGIGMGAAAAAPH
jgi:hypothetical protein